jgi:general secretion pathway protein D
MKQICLALFFLLAACATGPTPTEDARKKLDEGRSDEALAVLQKASRENPENMALRNEYYRMRDVVTAQWLAQAEALRQTARFDAAEVLYRRVLSHDHVNPRATAGLTQIETDRRHAAAAAQAEQLVRAGKYREAQDVLRPVLTENPQQKDARRLQRTIDEKLVPPVIVSAALKPASSKPISIELRDVTLRNIFETLQRATGINFIFDRDVRSDQRTTILLRDASIEDAIRMVLLTSSLEQKVLNENNADVKQTANMIRTLVKTRDIFIDEKINLLVIKDTPAAIRLAERLIAAQDLAEPEVMLEVEVIEVATNWLQQLGLQFPDTVAWSLIGAAGVPGQVTLPEWLNRSSNLVRLQFTDPLFLLSLKQQDGGANVLANPRIRVKNKEKARIHIGDRVPVITTTAAATGGFVSESVSYLDIGLKLEVEPLIFLEDEVGIKVGLEVSNIVKEIRSVGSNSLNYQIGTRNATTNLRLKDGETQVLAGLISREDRYSANRVPGMGELPIVGRLFSNTNDTRNRTEIMLLITPRLARALARPDASTVEFAAGTEASTGVPRLGGAPIAPIPVEPQPQSPTPDTSGAPAIPQQQQQQPPTGGTLVPFGGVKPTPQ